MTTTLTQTRTRTREPRRQPYVNAPLDGYRSDMEVQWASLFVCLCRLDSWKCITSQRPKVGSGAATTHHRRARALLFLAAAFPSDSRGEGHTLPRFSLSLSLAAAQVIANAVALAESVPAKVSAAMDNVLSDVDEVRARCFIFRLGCVLSLSLSHTFFFFAKRKVGARYVNVFCCGRTLSSLPNAELTLTVSTPTLFFFSLSLSQLPSIRGRKSVALLITAAVLRVVRDELDNDTTDDFARLAAVTAVLQQVTLCLSHSLSLTLSFSPSLSLCLSLDLSL